MFPESGETLGQSVPRGQGHRRGRGMASIYYIRRSTVSLGFLMRLRASISDSQKTKLTARDVHGDRIHKKR